MKFLDLFSGIGGFRLGLEKAGHECVGYAEIDEPAVRSYQAMYDTSNEAYFDDVTVISKDSSGLEKVDIITAGFPCFAGGTLITTERGLIPIEDVKVDDYVLTHTNMYAHVNKTMHKKQKGLYRIDVQGSVPTLVTAEHPFYVREKQIIERMNDAGKLVKRTEWTTSFWLLAKDLDPEKHVVAFPENREEINDRNMHMEDAYRIGLTIGHNAEEDKEIPDLLLSLPADVLEQSLLGILDAYGTKNNDSHTIFHSHKKFLLSMGQVIQKVWSVPYQIVEIDPYRYALRFQKKTEHRGMQHYDKEHHLLFLPIEEYTYLPDWEGTVYNLEVNGFNSYVANNMAVHNCQPFSVAGKGLAMKDDRGQLFMEVVRITKEFKPKYVIMENVLGLLSSMSEMDSELGIYELEESIKQLEDLGITKLTPVKDYELFLKNLWYYREYYRGMSETVDAYIKKPFIQKKLTKKMEVKSFVTKTFNIIINEFGKIGYDLEWRVFNTTEFGIPQSRIRVYIIATPRSESRREILSLIGTHYPTLDFRTRETEKEGPATNFNPLAIPVLNPMFTKRQNNGRIFKEHNEDMFTLTKVGKHGVYQISNEPIPYSEKVSDTVREIFDLEGVSATSDLYGSLRYLTPLEYWKLMGYDEELFEKASFVNDEKHLYHQAGNSITPQIVYNIGLLLEGDGD